ncbi:ABC transporter ATP-binding protein [Jannaschia sp. EhC01]|nr:ABC transporter ATP-binding protein [Jannaschia sp. EhC01]
MATLKLEKLEKRYGPVDVIKGIDLEIEDGEFVVFVGPSGCGKSTLLRMIAGLDDISGGALLIDGKRCNETEPRDRGIAMVFQSYALYPHLSVYENMSFGLTLQKMSKSEIEARVQKAARILKLGELLDRRPAALSGGQRQRVAIGRAITREPEVFLFDEPLSNLDAALRMETRMEIAELHRAFGATMIYVTHDQVEAMTLADKIVVLKDGLVQQVGTPLEIFHHPANLFVAGFMGSPRMNFFDVEIVDRSDELVTVKSASLAPVTVKAPTLPECDHAVLGIRPQHLRLATGQSPAGQLSGTVSLLERLGTETIVSFETVSQERVLATIYEAESFRGGDRINLQFDPASAHLFGAS